MYQSMRKGGIRFYLVPEKELDKLWNAMDFCQAVKDSGIIDLKDVISILCSYKTTDWRANTDLQELMKEAQDGIDFAQGIVNKYKKGQK